MARCQDSDKSMKTCGNETLPQSGKNIAVSAKSLKKEIMNAELKQELLLLIANGQYMAAISVARERTGLGILEAMELVTSLEEEENGDDELVCS